MSENTRPLRDFFQSLPIGSSDFVVGSDLTRMPAGALAGVTSVRAGIRVEVDSSSAQSPIVSLDVVAQNSLLKAETAVQPDDLSTVAITGNYADLLNKPSIPASQIPSDWNATSGDAQILNKPTLGALASKDDVTVSDIDASGTPGATTYLRGDGTWDVPDAGSGGQVNDVIEGTGITVDNTDPVNPIVNLSAASISSLSLADTAVQPGALATVATTGSYDDLLNKPTLGSASTSDVSAFATATQGTKADSAVQLATDKATAANIQAGASNKVLTADGIPAACALVTLTDAATVAVDWNTFEVAKVVLTGNRTIGNPSNVQEGTTRYLFIQGNDATARTISFASNFKGTIPTDTVTSTTWLLVGMTAYSSTHIVITSCKAL